MHPAICGGCSNKGLKIAFSPRFEIPVAQRVAQLYFAVQVEFAQCVADVRFSGFDRDDQLVGDLAVGEA